MFDQTFVNTHARTRRPWTIAASLGIQTFIVGTLLLVPILHPEILRPKIDAPLYVHLETLRKIVPTPAARGPAALTHSPAARVFVAPTVIPRGVPRIQDANLTAPDSFIVTGPPAGNGTGNASLADLIPGVPMTAPPPAVHTPPPQQVKPPAIPTGPLEVSQGVQAARLIFGPRPAYPTLAKAARVQGTVRIQAIIAADGSIGNLKVMSGPPLLLKAALEAVARWRYQPTLLSGRAVQVVTEIDVVFTLSQ